MTTTKVKASHQPLNTNFGIYLVDLCTTVKDVDTQAEIHFKTYNDALEGLYALGFVYWNPEESRKYREKPNHAAYVCYVDIIKPKPDNKALTETG